VTTVSGPQFRLEAVLRYRRSLEQKWQGEVAKTLSEIVGEQRERARVAEARVAGHRRMTEDLAAGTTAPAVRSYSDFLCGMDARIEESVHREAQLQKILKQKQRSLLQATKDRKAVDRLKEIFLERRAHAERTAEQKQLDDFAAIRHARRERSL
jgi:flagellar FliJ protein